MFKVTLCPKLQNAQNYTMSKITKCSKFSKNVKIIKCLITTKKLGFLFLNKKDKKIPSYKILSMKVKILRYIMVYTTFINQCKTSLDNVRHCQFWTLDIFL